MTPRFYVLEHSGYMAMSTGNSRSRQMTEVMVLDRDYRHTVVSSRLVQQNAWLVRARGDAKRLCARLNEEVAA